MFIDKYSKNLLYFLLVGNIKSKATVTKTQNETKNKRPDQCHAIGLNSAATKVHIA
jgi:hypothetical protein